MEPFASSPRFVADVHLGKLSRQLRLLGFDVVYRNDWQTSELVQAASSQARVLLSRNAAFSSKPIAFFYIVSEDADTQLAAVVQQFALTHYAAPFTRCLRCNGLLNEVDKQQVHHRLPEQTAIWYHQFWQCADCNRVYWKGTHYQRMARMVGQLMTSV